MEKIPVGKDYCIVVDVPPEGFDPEALAAALRPLRMTACHASRFSLAVEEIKRLVIEDGVSSVWRLVLLQEAVMPPTKHLEPLVRVLSEMLARLAPSRDFVIVDGHLFKKDPDSVLYRLLTSLLVPIARVVRRITFVTRSDLDLACFERVRKSLEAEAPLLSVACKESDDFHDRFWIADESRGLIVGTSPNGLGKRYALVDCMKPDDTREIVEALKARHLL